MCKQQAVTICTVSLPKSTQPACGCLACCEAGLHVTLCSTGVMHLRAGGGSTPPFRQAGDEFVGIGSLSSVLDFLLAGPWPPKNYVLPDSGGKQYWLLTHQTYLVAQPGQGQLPHVSPIQQDL